MEEIKRFLKISLILLFFIGGLNTCKEEKKVSFVNLDTLDKIKIRGSLRAVMDFNSTNYFIYRGEPMGYQYELLKLLAEYLEVKLEVIPENNVDKNFKMLDNSECDIIAINLAITKERSQKIDYTYPHSQTHQVLVQRKPENWKTLKNSVLEDQLIRNQLDLANKVVYVQKGTSYSQRIKNLSDEIGDNIIIIEKANLEVEELIELVANEEIDYTIADENVALVNQTYYTNLDVETAVSFPQNLAWGIRKGDKEFKRIVDEWLINFKKTRKYARIYNKYFKNSRSARIVESEFYAQSSGRVSEYDEYIKKCSDEIDWDWRLLASLICQESRFKPKIKSWAGAFGLMQLMPTTAERFGVNEHSHPEKQMKAGVDFIKWLDERVVNIGITDENEKIKFILAAYNAGLGHVLDARRLAEKEGKNPDVWENNVDEYILKKANPKYYKDPVVKYGYCRGSETYNYVYRILDRYEHYKNIIPES